MKKEKLSYRSRGDKETQFCTIRRVMIRRVKERKKDDRDVKIEKNTMLSYIFPFASSERSF